MKSMKMAKIERLHGVVDAQILGFLAGRGFDDGATYDGELVVVQVPGEEFLTTIHWSRVQDDEIQSRGRAYVADQAEEREGD